jgi:ABC-type amino acid transport system permease subunit
MLVTLASRQLGFVAPLLLRLMRRHLPSLLAARMASSGVMALVDSILVVVIFFMFFGLLAIGGNDFDLFDDHRVGWLPLEQDP